MGGDGPSKPSTRQLSPPGTREKRDDSPIIGCGQAEDGEPVAARGEGPGKLVHATAPVALLVVVSSRVCLPPEQPDPPTAAEGSRFASKYTLARKFRCLPINSEF